MSRCACRPRTDAVRPPEQPLDQLGLILLGPHRWRISVAAGVSAELGEHHRFFVSLVQPVQRAAEERLGHVELSRMLVPAGVAIEENDVRRLDAGRVRQVGGVADWPVPVQGPGHVA
jgi:hypothetical protein